MNKGNTYDLSISMATSLCSGIEDTGGPGDFSSFLSIRMEMTQFLLNLNYSNGTEDTGQQVHYLYLALNHLDQVDKKIRISGANQDMIRMEKIHQKIHSLKCLILNYIKHLTEGNHPMPS